MSLVPVRDDVVCAAFSFSLNQTLHRTAGLFMKPCIASAESNGFFSLPSASLAGPVT